MYESKTHTREGKGQFGGAAGGLGLWLGKSSGNVLGAPPNLRVCVYNHSSASLPEPWAAGPDTAGRRDLQTMFMTVGLLLGLATQDRLYTHTCTKAGPEPDCGDLGLT